MTVELMPVKNACNLRCSYCYEDPVRLGEKRSEISVEKMIKAIPQGIKSFTIFGGEPLLTPKKELIELFEHGLKAFGYNNIQTNGVLINDEWIKLFKDYKVSVGISIDGPGRLNDARSMGSPHRTLQATLKTEQAIRSLIENGIVPSIITTLHKINCGDPAKFFDLAGWFIDLDDLGVQYVRLHPLEQEPTHSNLLRLSDKREIEVYNMLYELQRKLKNIRFDIFEDIKQLLINENPSVSCVWNNCDVLTTNAVYGIDPQGNVINCGRTYKDGIVYRKNAQIGNERAIALFNTPQSEDGCQGCEYFYACKGNCPGTGINGDWRNRSEHCSLFKNLFELIRQDLGSTILDNQAKIKELEERVLGGRSENNTEHTDTPHVDFYKFKLPTIKDGEITNDFDFGR